jgi:hypothetical protein
MEMIKTDTNWILVGTLITLALALVYLVLPRLFKNYSTEKGFKLALFYGMMAYLSYDYYQKEKYYYIIFFAVGAIIFTYLIWIAKKKV